MKKILVFLMLALVLSLNFQIGSVGAVTYGEDAKFTPAFSGSTPYYIMGSETEPTGSDTGLCQSFKPVRTPLANYVDLLVASNDPSSQTNIKVTLRPNVAQIEVPPGTPPEAMPTFMERFDDTKEAIATFTSSSVSPLPVPGLTNLNMTKFSNSSGQSINVTPNTVYWLCLEVVPTYPHFTYWYGRNDNQYTDMDRFALRWGAMGLDQGADLGFITYSRVADAPVVTPPTSTPTVTTAATPIPTGVTAGSGAAPAATTTSIKSPTELVVADAPADQGGALKLDWKASTTADIDGYKVFRSTEEKKNFKEIAKTTDKAILTYTDNTAAIGTKYYYMVRAYKTTKESVSTNTANGTSVDNTPPTAPKNFTFKNATNGDITFNWDKNTEADLSGYILEVISPTDSSIVESIEVGKDLNSYILKLTEHTKMTAGTAYTYKLVAKDSNTNLSAKTDALLAKLVKKAAAKTTSALSDKEADSLNIWYLVSGIIFLLAVIGGGLYFWKFRKAKKV